MVARVVINVRIKRELKAAVARRAEAEGTTMSAWVESLLSRAVGAVEPKQPAPVAKKKEPKPEPEVPTMTLAERRAMLHHKRAAD